MDYASHNSQVFKIGLRDYAQNIVKAKLLSQLGQIAGRMVELIDNSFAMPDGTEQFPVYSANMRDATGVGVYADGMIVRYLPTKRATKMAGMGGLHTKMSGHDALNNAISYGLSMFSRGIWLVLFSAMPYATMIDMYGSKIGRGVNFFGALKQSLITDVFNTLKPMIK